MDVEIYDDVAYQYQGKILKIFAEIFSFYIPWKYKNPLVSERKWYLK